MTQASSKRPRAIAGTVEYPQDLDRVAEQAVGTIYGVFGTTSSRVPGTRPARSISGLLGRNVLQKTAMDEISIMLIYIDRNGSISLKHATFRNVDLRTLG